MDTGGLSGTVNIDTIHPLDYKGPHLTLTAKGYDNTYRGGVTPKVGGSYIGSFADDTLGVMVNVDYQKLHGSRRLRVHRPLVSSRQQRSNASIPKRFRYRRIDRNTEQLMASGALQWKPTDNLEACSRRILARSHHLQHAAAGLRFSDSNITVNKSSNGVAKTSPWPTARWITTTSPSARPSDPGLYRHLNWKPDGWKIHAAGHYTVGTAHLYEWASILGMNMTSPTTLDISNPNISFTPPTA
jgi:hypothetical protein